MIQILVQVKVKSENENKNTNTKEEKSGSRAGRARLVLVPSRAKTTALCLRILHESAKVPVTETLALLVSWVCNRPRWFLPDDLMVSHETIE